jgi:predicted alpha/beta hydrolase
MQTIHTVGPEPGVCWLQMPDDYALQLRVFPATMPRAVLVVHPAMGISQRYYAPFAWFMAQQGFTVITYDYRGMGASAPPQLRPDFAVGFRQLAHDAGQVLAYVYHAFPTLPLGAIGHSIGGLFPLMTPHNHLLDSFLMVGTQLADPTDFGPGWWPRFRTSLLWFGVLPLLTRCYGYFPGRQFRLGLGNLPARFVTELSQRRHREPIHDFLARVGSTDHHQTLRCPMLAVAATDDPICTERAMRRLRQQMPGKTLEQRRIRPIEVGATAIGHVRFFSRSFAKTLWPIAADWFNQTILLDESAPVLATLSSPAPLPHPDEALPFVTVL